MSYSYKYLITGLNDINHVYVMSLCKTIDEVIEKLNKFRKLPHHKELKVTNWNFN